MVHLALNLHSINAGIRLMGVDCAFISISHSVIFRLFLASRLLSVRVFRSNVGLCDIARNGVGAVIGR